LTPVARNYLDWWVDGGETEGWALEQFKITKRAVDGLAPGPKPYTRFDASIKGFGVEIRPSGLKVYVLHYRPGAGGRAVAKKRLVLGYHGEITAEEARRLALDARALIRLGEDPAGERTRQRAALTVGDLCDAFDADHVAKLKPGSAESYRVALAKLKAAYGSLPAESLSRSQVAALHAKAAATPYAANKLVTVISVMFGWGETRGLVPEGCRNPTRGITRYREQGRERFLTGDELGRLGDALREGETIGLPFVVEDGPNAKHAPKSGLTKLDPFSAGAIRLLILTGARLREILHARWDGFDPERAALFLADSKTGKKMLHLSPRALSVIAGLPKVQDNPFMFPGEPGKPRDGMRKAWAAVCRRAGLDGLRAHDLRHSFASFGAGMGIGLPLLGKLLGHASQATTARYSHIADDPARAAADRIGARIEGAMRGGAGEIIRPRRFSEQDNDNGGVAMTRRLREG
jgi:integrase